MNMFDLQDPGKTAGKIDSWYKIQSYIKHQAVRHFTWLSVNTDTSATLLWFLSAKALPYKTLIAFYKLYPVHQYEYSLVNFRLNMSLKEVLAA